LANQLHHPKISPQPELISQAKKVIALKDAVILAEAKTAQPHYLVSLDRKHFFTPTARRFIRPTKIVTPKDLL
jgi:predicted nucleic acid-binding protein